ncbi:MAG: hypothetical protein QNJ89_08410, partial [Acidimicrobiia bacterium]|nr:hypothetical protein [Acidimicrobiia bacterium]
DGHPDLQHRITTTNSTTGRFSQHEHNISTNTDKNRYNTQNAPLGRGSGSGVQARPHPDVPRVALWANR